MLRSLKAMHGYAVLAKDGDIGKVHTRNRSEGMPLAR